MKWLVTARMSLPDDLQDLHIAGVLEWLKNDIEFDLEADARRFVRTMKTAHPTISWRLYEQTQAPEWRRVP